MKVLLACEESQVVCIEFRKRGHEAYSCDLQPCSGGHPEWHIQGDVREVLREYWDIIIAFPTCTYLCNSGVQWLYNPDKSYNIERCTKLEKAKQFFYLFYDHLCKKIAIENPIPHKHARLPAYTQIIQPWQFGHGETKKTCLWLKGLPKLKPTNIVEGREARIHKMPPGENRSKLRSKTFPGIAQAFANQYGGLNE